MHAVCKDVVGAGRSDGTTGTPLRRTLGENMRITRWAAPLGAAGLLSFTLAGCEVTGLYAAHCVTSPSVPHQDQGNIGAVGDVPPEVNPGQTFTVTINSIGVEAGPSQSPPPARYATVTLSGAASPTGNIAIGSLEQPAVWPRQIPVTATGQAGQSIVVSVYSADQFYGTPTNGYLLSCHALGDTTLATIPIVAPEP